MLPKYNYNKGIMYILSLYCRNTTDCQTYYSVKAETQWAKLNKDLNFPIKCSAWI